MAKVRTPPRTVTQRQQTTKTAARRHPRSPTSALFAPALLAHAFELVQIIDATGRIRYVSPTITRVLGYQPQAVQGKESASFVDPDDLPRLREVAADLLRQPSGSSARQEYRVRHQDGSWRLFEGVATNLVEDPAVAGIVINARDITERAHTAASLQESEVRYRRLAELSPNPVFVHAEGKLLYVNAATVTFFGARSAEELLGKSIYDLVPPTSHAIQQQRIRQILTEGRAAQFLKFPFVRLDGQTSEAEAAGAAITYAGTPAVQTVLRELTVAPRDDQALQASEERYHQLFENANDIIAAFTVDGAITEVNKVVQVLLGWTPEELIGRHYFLVLTPAAQALAEDRTRRYLAGEKMDSIFEIDVVRKDSTTVPVEGRTRPIHDRQGQLVGFQGIFRDISERRKAAAALAESQRLQERIADILPEILYLYDVVDQQVLYVNQRIVMVLGYPPAYFKEQVGPLFDNLLHPDDRARFTLRLSKLATAPDERIIETEFRLRHANGEWRTLHSREQIGGRTGSGTVKQILGTAQDVTDRKRLASQLGSGVLDKQRIGVRLRDLRKQLALTQAAFGRQFGGFNQRQIFSYESGEADVPLTLLLAIHARGYPLEEVLGVGTKPITETTIQYFSATYRTRIVLRRLLDTAARLLGRDQDTIDQALEELGIPLKDLTPEQRKLVDQLADLDKLTE